MNDVSPYLISPPVSEIIETTEELWDFTDSHPLPRGDWLKCGICGGAPLIRDWVYHRRPFATYKYRCDIRFKCKRCATVWTHGIAVPQDKWPGEMSITRKEAYE